MTTPSVQVQFAHPWTDPASGTSYTPGQLAYFDEDTARRLVYNGLAKYVTDGTGPLVPPGTVDDVELMAALEAYEKKISRDGAAPGYVVSLGDGGALILTPASGPTGSDGQIVGGATATMQGLVQLVGDLGGTADAPTVPGLAQRLTLEQVQDAVATMIVGGSNIATAYDDANGTLTITSTATGGTGSGTDPELVRDTIGTALVAGAGVQIAVSDDANTITISAPGAASGTDPEVVRDTVAASLRAGSNVQIVVDDVADTITIAAPGVAGLTAEDVQDIVAAFIAPGAGLTKSYDDGANTLTLTVTGAVGGNADPEFVRDTVAAALTGSSKVQIVHNDDANTITITTSATVNQPDTYLLDRINHTGIPTVPDWAPNTPYPANALVLRNGALQVSKQVLTPTGSFDQTSWYAQGVQAQVQVPAKVTGVAVGTRTPTAINLSWSAVPGATNYVVEYRRTDTVTWTTSMPFTVADGLIDGLTSGTSYAMRVIARNSAGAGAASDIIQTSTATNAAAPNFTVSNLRWTPENPKVGDRVTFTADVTNIGATSPNRVIDVQFSVNAGEYVTISDNYSGALAAGATVALTANTGPSGATWAPTTDGVYSVQATVDSGLRFPEETDRSNNTTTGTVNVAPAAQQLQHSQFESGTDGWVVFLSTGTAVRSTTSAPTGAGALLVTKTDTTGNLNVRGPEMTSGIVPGRPITVEYKFRPEVTLRGFYAYLQWNRADGGYLGTSPGRWVGAEEQTLNSVHARSFTDTAPAEAARAIVVLQLVGAAPGDRFRADDVLVTIPVSSGSIPTARTMPPRVVEGCFPNYVQGMRLRDVHNNYNVLKVSFAIGVEGDPGAMQLGYLGGANTLETLRADIAELDAEGKVVTLALGGAEDMGNYAGYQLQTIQHVDRFMATVPSIIDSLGGPTKVRGVEWDLEHSNNFTPSAVVTASQRLKALYGPSFAVTAAPYGLHNTGTSHPHDSGGEIPLVQEYRDIIIGLGSDFDHVSIQFYNNGDNTIAAIKKTASDFLLSTGLPDSKLVFGFMMAPRHEVVSGGVSYQFITDLWESWRADGREARGIFIWEVDLDRQEGWKFATGPGVTVLNTPGGGEAATPPNAPTIGTATATVGGATVAFSSPTSGPAPTSYTVIPYIGSTPQTPQSGFTASPAAVTGLTAGTAYTFAVRSVGAGGSSAESAKSNSVTPQAPAAPSTHYSQDFSVDTGTWRPKANATAPTRDTTRHASGSLRWTTITAAPTEVEGPDPAFAVVGGQTYTLNGSLSHDNSVGRLFKIGMLFYGADGGFIDAPTGGDAQVNPGTSFTPLATTSLIAPVGATQARVFVQTAYADQIIDAGVALYVRAITVTVPGAGGTGTPTGGMPLATNRGGTGVARTANTATTVASNTTWSNQDFTASVFDLTGKTNITFNNCKFPRITLGDGTAKDRVFNDCEIDGKQYLDGAAIFGSGAVFNRCKTWNAAQGIAGHIIDYDDGWIGDLWGGAATHSEAVLIGKPGGGAARAFRARGSTLLGTYRSGAPGGGMSGAVALYNHSDGTFAWGPHADHVVTGCWLQSLSTTNFTVYWSTGSTSHRMDNCILENNIFVRSAAGSTSAPLGHADIRPNPNYAGGTGNVIRGNKYDTGETLGAPNEAAVNTFAPIGSLDFQTGDLLQWRGSDGDAPVVVDTGDPLLPYAAKFRVHDATRMPTADAGNTRRAEVYTTQEKSRIVRGATTHESWVHWLPANMVAPTNNPDNGGWLYLRQAHHAGGGQVPWSVNIVPGSSPPRLRLSTDSGSFDLGNVPTTTQRTIDGVLYNRVAFVTATTWHESSTIGRVTVEVNGSVLVNNQPAATMRSNGAGGALAQWFKMGPYGNRYTSGTTPEPELTYLAGGLVSADTRPAVIRTSPPAIISNPAYDQDFNVDAGSWVGAINHTALARTTARKYGRSAGSLFWRAPADGATRVRLAPASGIACQTGEVWRIGGVLSSNVTDARSVLFEVEFLDGANGYRTELSGQGFSLMTSGPGFNYFSIEFTVPSTASIAKFTPMVTINPAAAGQEFYLGHVRARRIASVGAPISAPSGAKPPSGGYRTTMQPVGYTPLTDEQAAALVRRSTWEPRPENTTANQNAVYHVPTREGETMQNNDQVFLKVTGNFKGTTDEIIQWAAAKWGIPDDLLRAVAYTESSWRQSGIGDNGESYGLTQVRGVSNSGGTPAHPNTMPYAQTSTAFNVDYYGAMFRGTYNGWEGYGWLGPNYSAGDMHGVLGRWFAGNWHSAAGDSYADHVLSVLQSKPWLAAGF